MTTLSKYPLKIGRHLVNWQPYKKSALFFLAKAVVEYHLELVIRGEKEKK